MPEYDPEMTGGLWKNDRKRAGKKDPDYTGKCCINGVEYWLSCWDKVAKNGDNFFSLTFKPKEAAQPRQTPPAKAAPPKQTQAPIEDEGDLDSIPF